MHNHTERSEQYISRLVDFIVREYNLTVTSIMPAKRGYNGETWRLNTPGLGYFVKIVSGEAHKPLYERSFPVIERINQYGVDCISRIVKTATGFLFTHFEGAIVGVFDWIEGENVQDERTKLPEYQMLAKVYTVPTDELAMPKERFEAESADLFFSQWDELMRRSSSERTAALLCLFETHGAIFRRLLARLCMFSERCKVDLSHRYITHGDAGGNVIISSDRFYLVDWDDPVIAPPERDAWFCMHWAWAMDGFNEALRQNGIQYTLRPERLAYYCYHSFFYYLTKYIGTYLESGDGNGALTSEIAEYIQNCWIYDNIKFADENIK
ncbi:MAG: aminoglycoside phosphotransferase family protein [Oscillospiraceae bacterium]|jgi:hypothetical protein|nr:aminoglycoside phosphotransferase family protein [Oscillospiraceae bacterium]